MKRKTNVGNANLCVREQNAELIGILTAISIVSKRLAGRLAALERQTTTKTEKGGKTHGKDET